ncbi:MAG: FAD-binding oxidoreductase [Luteibaculaceae bacterium]
MIQTALLTPTDVTYFASIVGSKYAFTDTETLENYAHDETEDLHFLPSLVLKPGSAAEIGAILAHCSKHKIPVTPVGARTGLSGGALPNHGGIALSTERLNKIVDIDTKNLQVTVETGVITQVLQEAVAEVGLFYPPDPSSKGSCFIGGNLAESSGGPKAVKYGVTKDYVLNLEVVLPTGEIIWTGANTLKNATGYNLTQLMVGSEGTLGVITKAVLKLLPLPTKNLLILVPFFSALEACEAVSAILRAGVTPSALEFMERDAIDWAIKFVDGINIPIQDEVQAHLLIEVDGNKDEVLQDEIAQICAVLEQFNIDEILFAEDQAQKDALWRMRRRIGEAVKSNSVYKEEDTVVPRYYLPQLLSGVKEIGHKYGFKSVCYGHAGDGNLHVNIVRGSLSQSDWDNEVPKGIFEIFELVKSLGGTISGEHGIGLVQKPYLSVVFSDAHFALMRGIKQTFDPANILNPGKIFDISR